MITATDKDVGRKVIYQKDRHWAEEGVITSVHDTYIHVRYGAEQTSKQTNPDDLDWSDNGTS